ncbi:hypothetical protein [Spirosoma endbachense]|uniref:DUF4386 family protein n=1 Tax=Spirosoma endbachense TaxID=2666025 RepID=A0A6P1VW43_9BACT|nr:hypothetical protein [Spirosoma endbachense]QHV96975.1 hypothetical protein GJR95_19050 [Spirosoma endbachense]
MRQGLLIFGVTVCLLACVAGYFLALVDWIEDFKTGVYAANHAEALLETGAILIYTYAGFDFFKRKLAH